MKKIIISAISALVLLNSTIIRPDSFYFSANALDLEYNGFTYILNNRGNITITGYSGDETSIIVPDIIDDLPVTTILSKAFYSSYVKGAYIPESVVAIGEDIMWNANGDDAVIFGESGSYAETYSQNNSYNFFASDGLNGSFGDDIHWSFDIPTFSLSVWGSGAMPVYSGYDIYTLESYKAKENIPWYNFRHSILLADIGGTVSTIGEAAFYDCDKMKTVTMNDSITKIDSYAFAECEKLESIEFSDSLSYLSQYVFVRCYELTELDFSSSLQTFYSTAFNGCDSLCAVNIDSRNPYLCSADGVVYNKDMTVLSFYPDAKTEKSFVIPDTVVEIDNYAIEGAEILEELVLPTNLEYIGTEALALTGVKKLVIPESVTYLGKNCLYSNLMESVIFKGSAPSHSSSLFNTRGASATDVYCHFSDTSWYVFMDEFTDNVNWKDLDIYPENGIELSASSVTVKEKEEISVEAKISPVISDSLVWKSSNESVAIANNGVITGISRGTCDVTVSDSDGEYSAVCRVTVTPGKISENVEPVMTAEGKASSNKSANNYSIWASTVKSYLSETSDGLLERVEYADSKIIVEQYEKTGGVPVKSIEIEPAFDSFGGYFCGEKYNYIVSGQNNATGSSTAEVLNVEKYSKDWKKLSSLGIPSGDTYIPFDAGSCRITEKGDLLFIHTSQELQIGHQSNMTFKVDTENMKIIESMTFINTISTLTNFEQEGFASHSFNQFIKEDNGYIYRVDHGEGAMHGIGISKCTVEGSIKDVSTIISYPFHKGNTNATGASVGGFELSTENVIIAANSIDQTLDTYPYGQRNILLSITTKGLKNPRTVWLTNYNQNSDVSVGTPQIVKFGSELFVIMWEESVNGVKTTKAVTVDGNGNKLTEILTIPYSLSDCQPSYMTDGYIRWYVSDSETISIYSIDPYKLGSYISNTEGDVNGDERFSIADLVTMQKFLIGNGSLCCWKNGDLCADNKIDIFDMILMRQLIIEQNI